MEIVPLGSAGIRDVGIRLMKEIRGLSCPALIEKRPSDAAWILFRRRREAVWCLFGVCFWRALESTSETWETIETSLKRKKIKELFRK
jgi:hypothetical protein